MDYERTGTPDTFRLKGRKPVHGLRHVYLRTERGERSPIVYAADSQNPMMSKDPPFLTLIN